MDSTDDDLTLSILERRNNHSDDKSKIESWSTERDVFELQLNQLQEQLVAAMVQNQHLEEENKKLQKKNGADLLKELQEEKEKRKIAQETLDSLVAQRKRESFEARNVSSFDHDFDDLSSELGEKPKQDKVPTSVVSKQRRLKQKIFEYKIILWNFAHERISDFVNDEDFKVEEEEDEPLSVKRLKENVGRFSDSIEPFKSTFTFLYNLFSWKNPWFTSTVFLIYMYSLWTEMFIPLCLMLALLQLSMNYLHARGIAQKFTVARKDSGPTETSKDDTSSSNTLSERYQLVLQIARKVQNALGSIADGLEKIQNLFLWQHAEASKQLYQLFIFLFVVSVLLPTNVFLMVVGILAGMKLFLITPIYTRFPKVQRRYDDTQRLWAELPTHAENMRNKMREFEANEKDSSSKASSQSPTHANQSASSSTSQSSSSKSTKSEKKEEETSWEAIVFSDRFQIPRNEVPLHDWHEGRRCTLMDKDSPLSSMKHGRMYLTTNYVCFERNQFHSKKNNAINLSEIESIKKAKPISFMPGPGMAIEISVKETTKPYLFAAMMGRDEAFESIVRAGKLLNLPWSMR